MASNSKLAAASTGNLFLDALPAKSAAAFVPKLEEVWLDLGSLIAAVGASTEYAYFPVDSVVSAVTVMRDGMGVEVTLFGRDGFYGVHMALGVPASATEAMIQLPGTLLRMRAADFAAHLRDDPALRDKALRYAHVTLVTVSQFSACNRLHATTERCARWLLMAHDRVANDELLLTHEYLATMLGVRRPSVSVAAGELEAAGYIEYHRGRIVMLNRAGLEAIACECYAFVNDAVARLMGYDTRKASRPANSSSEPSSVS